MGSRRKEPVLLANQLGTLIRECNRALRGKILSPYTVTLGDEFQGVAKNLRALVQTIFWLEEATLRSGYDFKIHYVAHWGQIDTPINMRIAHGMIGSGLTKTRSILTKKTKERPRMYFDLPSEEAASVFNDISFVLSKGIDVWKSRDFAIISSLIENPDNAAVGGACGLNRTTVWRRRKHLRIEEYLHLKAALLTLSNVSDLHLKER